jgi:hypothetical protein
MLHKVHIQINKPLKQVLQASCTKDCIYDILLTTDVHVFQSSP